MHVQWKCIKLTQELADPSREYEMQKDSPLASTFYEW